MQIVGVEKGSLIVILKLMMLIDVGFYLGNDVPVTREYELCFGL